MVIYYEYELLSVIIAYGNVKVLRNLDENTGLCNHPKCVMIAYTLFLPQLKDALS